MFSFLFFYNKPRPIFCSVGTPSKRKVHEMKIIWEDDFSVIDTGGYGEKLRVLPIGDEPMAL